MADFDWQEFFRLAVDLAQDSGRMDSDEALRRTVMSRAYYACYHHALGTAQRLGYGSGPVMTTRVP